MQVSTLMKDQGYRSVGESADWTDEAWLVHEHGYAVIRQDDDDQIWFTAYIEHDDLENKACKSISIEDVDELASVLSDLERFEWVHQTMDIKGASYKATQCALITNEAIKVTNECDNVTADVIAIVDASGFDY